MFSYFDDGFRLRQNKFLFVLAVGGGSAGDDTVFNKNLSCDWVSLSKAKYFHCVHIYLCIFSFVGHHLLNWGFIHWIWPFFQVVVNKQPDPLVYKVYCDFKNNNISNELFQQDAFCRTYAYHRVTFCPILPCSCKWCVIVIRLNGLVDERNVMWVFEIETSTAQWALLKIM